jgi:3'(2'), 5'-bisphosphate nucleotidase
MIKDMIEIARLAGAEILKVYKREDFEKSVKEDNSPLTEADLAANKVITSMLQEKYPQIKLLSEESKEIPYSERKDWNEYFLIDPLDGTKEFIKRNGEFTVNIAFIKNGVPQLGVVYAPVKDILYYNTDATHAYREAAGDKVQLPSDKFIPTQYTIVASRSHMSDETKEYIATLEKEHGEVNIISMGSSFKLCLVAEGSAHEYPRLAPTSEWDIAAAHAVVMASGGDVVKFDSRERVQYNKEDILNPYFLVKRS